MRRGAPRSNLQTIAEISPTELTPLYREPVQHTGDFEELRNFGMCLDLVGAAALKREVKLSLSKADIWLVRIGPCTRVRRPNW